MITKEYSAIARKSGSAVGENSQLWGYTDCIFPHLITVGRNCILATDSALLCHGPLVSPTGGAPVTVEDNCFIGFGAIILPGVTVGEGCIVGAGSVVTCDVPPRSIVAGNPARVIRQRDEEEYTRYVAGLESGNPRLANRDMMDR